MLAYRFFFSFCLYVPYMTVDTFGDGKKDMQKKREHVKFISLFTVIVKKDGFKVSFGPVLQDSNTV